MVSPISFRLGVQFNKYLAIVYQNSAIVTLLVNPTDNSEGVEAAAIDENAALVILTLGNFLDLGVGPSLDVYASAGASLNGGNPSAGSSTGVWPGIATRIAVNLGGGPSKENGRRIGFNLSIDPHSSFYPGTGTLLTVPVGIGAEFF